MKKLLAVVLTSILALSIVGCSSNETANNAKETYGCDTLNVFNWGEYVGETVISDFEDEYGVNVNYSLFESNEVMYTQLQGGNNYDVLIPSDYMVERLMAEDLLATLDLSKIPNIANLADGVKNLDYDPNNEYSIPYFWGNVGIVYNKTTIDPELVEELGFNIFLEPELKDRAYLYDSERDSFMMAFKALGYSMNTENPDEIQAAYDWLLEVNEIINPSYVTDEVIDAMVNGNKDIAVVYSGDASYILSENEDMAFSAPQAGTNLWSDSMVIPASSECQELAHVFINYMLDEEVSLANSTYVGYTANTNYAIEALSTEGGDYEGINSYIPRNGNPNDEIFKHNEVLVKELSELWIKVKSQ